MSHDETPTVTDATAVTAPAEPRWGVGLASVGVILALLGILGFEALVRAVVVPYEWQVVLSYAVVWVPLLAVLAWAVYARGSGSWVRDLGLRFRWIDILWGIGLGLVMRGFAVMIELVVYGHPSGSLIISPTDRDGWWLFGAVLAPAVIGPVVEELYFRGLVQRAVALTAGSVWIGVVASALVFGLLHTTDASTPQGGLVIGLSTALFGAAAGVLVALTGRLGGAIIAHVVFNGIALLVFGV